MAIIEKEITDIIKIAVCDTCKVEIGTGYLLRRTCAMCNKHSCNKHMGEKCEDGQLCAECYKEYEFDFHEFGGVGIIHREDGKDVYAPYL